MKSTLAAPVIALMLAPLPVMAQGTGPVQASDPQGIASLMQKWGYRAELTTDDEGDPKILSAAGGANFSVWFYGCSNGKDCDSIQFSAGFDTEDGINFALANDWNTTKRFGKVYLDDENDPFIEMDINLEEGISEGLMRDNFKVWEQLIADFQQHIDW